MPSNADLFAKYVELKLIPIYESDAQRIRALVDYFTKRDKRETPYNADSFRKRLNAMKEKSQPAQKPASNVISWTDRIKQFEEDDETFVQDDTPEIYRRLSELKRQHNYLRVQVISDEHFDDHDERACAMNVAIAEWFQPHVRVWNGDTLDFPSLSHFMLDRREGNQDAFKTVRKPLWAYAKAHKAASPNTLDIVLDGNHNARAEAFANVSWQLGDTIEEAYADLVRCDGRLLWMNGKEEIEICGYFIQHGRRTGKYVANNTEDDLGGGQPGSSGHTHGVNEAVRRVKVQGEQRFKVVQYVVAGFAGKNPPRYMKRRTDLTKWIHSCQIAHVNTKGDDVHIQKIIYHELQDGSLTAFCGIQQFCVQVVKSQAARDAA